MSKYLNSTNCPYCGEEVEVNTDDCNNTQHELNEMQCNHCEKNFMVETYIKLEHTAMKADCLNSKKHEWEHINGYPTEFYVGEFRCKNCKKTKTDEEANKKAREKYYKEHLNN